MSLFGFVIRSRAAFSVLFLGGVLDSNIYIYILIYIYIFYLFMEINYYYGSMTGRSPKP